MHIEPYPCPITLTTVGHCHPTSRTEGFIPPFRKHTFNNNGPKDRLDYSPSLSLSFLEENLRILPSNGLLANHGYLVPSVGKEAQQSLLELGRLAMVLNGSQHACHVGTVHLSGPIPKLHDLYGDLLIEEGRP